MGGTANVMVLRWGQAAGSPLGREGRLDPDEPGGKAAR